MAITTHTLTIENVETGEIEISTGYAVESPEDLAALFALFDDDFLPIEESLIDYDDTF